MRGKARNLAMFLKTYQVQTIGFRCNDSFIEIPEKLNAQQKRVGCRNIAIAM